MGASSSKNKNNSQEKLENNKITNDSLNLANDNNYIKQKHIIDHPDYISKKDEQYINKQMKYCICKIKSDKNFGTGFFCRINPNQMKDNNYSYNYFPVLITSNQILGKNEISYGKCIDFSIDDESYSYKIIIDDSRFTYIDELYNITIIEIKKEDQLNICGLEIDLEVYKSESLTKFAQRTIYLIYYSDSIYSEDSFGIIKSISLDNFTIKHTCKHNKGALGCPILNLQNFKVIGIQKNKNNNCFLGTFIYPILKSLAILNLKKYSFILKTIEEKEYDRCVFFCDLFSFFNIRIPCSGDNIFVQVEKILYEKCAQYKNTKNIFIKNKKIIGKYDTVDENQCGDGLPVFIISENKNKPLFNYFNNFGNFGQFILPENDLNMNLMFNNFNKFNGFWPLIFPDNRQNMNLMLNNFNGFDPTSNFVNHFFNMMNNYEINNTLK